MRDLRDAAGPLTRSWPAPSAERARNRLRTLMACAYRARELPRLARTDGPPPDRPFAARMRAASGRIGATIEALGRDPGRPGRDFSGPANGPSGMASRIRHWRGATAGWMAC